MAIISWVQVLHFWWGKINYVGQVFSLLGRVEGVSLLLVLFEFSLKKDQLYHLNVKKKKRAGGRRKKEIPLAFSL